MNNLEITKENYKGYVELYRSYEYWINEKYKEEAYKKIKIVIMLILVTIIPVMMLIPLISFNLAALLTVIYVVSSISSPFLIPYSVLKKQQKDLKKEYDYIDIKIDRKVLVNALKKAHILKYENGKEMLDTVYYENYLECNKIKKQVITENKYMSVNADYQISEGEMSKVKSKIKVKDNVRY